MRGRAARRRSGSSPHATPQKSTPAFAAVATSTYESPTSNVASGVVCVTRMSSAMPVGSGFRVGSVSPPISARNVVSTPRPSRIRARVPFGLVAAHGERDAGAVERRERVGDAGIEHRRVEEMLAVEVEEAPHALVDVGGARRAERPLDQSPRALADQRVNRRGGISGRPNVRSTWFVAAARSARESISVPSRSNATCA
jgi:hypothetical protein